MLPAVAVESTMVRLPVTSFGPGGPCIPCGPCGPAGPCGPGEIVNAAAYNGTRVVNTLLPPCVTSKYLELPAGKFAGTSPPGRPSSRSTNPVSLLMFDPASVSTVCASEKMTAPPAAWSHTSNCTATPVLLTGSELAKDD